MELEAWAGEAGKRPHAGKRSQDARGLPSQDSLQVRAFRHAAQGPQGGATYKTEHIWPDGAAFPRKTWPRSPGPQPPFKDRREGMRSKADLRESSLPGGHSPPCLSPGGREARCSPQPWCSSRSTHQAHLFRSREGNIFQACTKPDKRGLVLTLQRGIFVA